MGWVRKAGVDKALFGSNYLLNDPGVEAAKFRALPMSREELDHIGNLNAKELLGID